MDNANPTTAITPTHLVVDALTVSPESNQEYSSEGGSSSSATTTTATIAAAADLNENEEDNNDDEDNNNDEVASSNDLRNAVVAATAAAPFSEDQARIQPPPLYDFLPQVYHQQDSADNAFFLGHNHDGGAPPLQQQQQPTTTQPPQIKPEKNNKKRQAEEEQVIDLLDSDDDINDDDANKRPKKPNLNFAPAAAAAAAMQSYEKRQMPDWMMMKNNKSKNINSTADAAAVSREQHQEQQRLPRQQQQQQQQQQHHLLPKVDRITERPHYMAFPPKFVPTWQNLVPPRSTIVVAAPVASLSLGHNGSSTDRPVAFALSLLNVNEFTLEATYRNGTSTTDISGLRKPLRHICQRHHLGGKNNAAAYRDPVTRKWRIPLMCYQDVLLYLTHQLKCRQVTGIPPTQLQIALLERERQEKGYPDVATIISYGVPPLIAETLAPFQRGGVDFVHEKDGRALIADEMGLGKSIQAVASMSMYRSEWPLLVITPSGARYHWEHEFKHWLRDTLVHDNDVYVMTSGNDIIPPAAKVVIYSYGLIKAIPPHYFNCAICDESHMLKNCHSKRTLTLAPILKATKRCLLLSGTPALARPLELWPQLDILNISSFGWSIDYGTFERKFSKKDNDGGNGAGGSHHRAELHTMLTGTVMIRRLKNDILKTMPKKVRWLARVCCVKSESQRATFAKLMGLLRESKGVMGKLANAQRRVNKQNGVGVHDEFGRADDNNIVAANENHRRDNNNNAAVAGFFGGLPPPPRSREEREQHEAFRQMQEREFALGCIEIRERIRHQAAFVTPQEFAMLEAHMQDNLRQRMGYFPPPPPAQQEQQRGDPEDEEDEEVSKKNTLSKLYSLTAEVKIPLVVDMLKRWLADNTKGKICIFAHHLSVLDALQKQCDLGHQSNKKFIRIDGSTSPRLRQDQITAFQSDPSVRVALLGITAAGVAVTLTAASTVWFAELFWTPAIMIQAEDRCHRIGQAAQVKCLYLVAKGTLDDVLWRLIEAKFRDLGEFVEGKERLKLVVETVYETNADLMSALFAVPADTGNDDGPDYDDNGNPMTDFNLSFDDIAELGAEERKMLAVDGEEVVLAPDAAVDDEGQNEHSAILLLDDDEVEMEKKPAAQTESREGGGRDDANNKLGHDKPESDNMIDVQDGPDAIPADSILWGCRLFKVIFSTSVLGVTVKIFHGRVVIFKVSPQRRAALGDNCKPAVGDILVSIGGYPLPIHDDLNYILNFMAYFLKNPPVEMHFVEAPRVAFEFLNSLVQAPIMAPPNPLVATQGNQVIELLDD